MTYTKITTNLATGQFWQAETLPAAVDFDCVHGVCLYPTEVADNHSFEGFGGAFTEAAAVCLQPLNAAEQARFNAAYFGADGLRYALGRTHMGSCDFALGNYTAANKTDNNRDFSRDDTVLIPMIQAAEKAAGKALPLLLSPWSPPAWMKTNGDMNHGGKLKPECAAAYAKLLADYAAHYRAAGLTVAALSIQNEPEAVQTWDSCIFTAEEEAQFAVSYLRPALDAAGLNDVELLCWDHNKEGLYRRAVGSFGVPGAEKAIAGVGFHWYTGDHFEAVALVAKKYPGKKLYFTEGCVEYSRFDGATDQKKAEMYAHDILGNLNAGIVGSIDWNLLLDAKGGPNHVGNFCEAPLMLDGNGSFEIKGSYYYIGQFSRYIQPGARRIAASRYCAELEVTAFQNPDGSLTAVLLNRTAAPQPASLALNGETPLADLVVEPHSIVTVVL